MLPSDVEENAKTNGQIDFLWLELTNQCNLQCSHCYADSGPFGGSGDRLSRVRYRELILEAYEAGCRRIQFIGGEPTLNRDLPELIGLASDTCYSFIEVFTNLTRLSSELLFCFKSHRVNIATSVYAALATTHDKITKLEGSFEKTTGNLRLLLQAEIPVRVGVIEMEENAGQTEATVQFLRDLGVRNVGTDRVRHFGRGSTSSASELSELCGACAENTLCVGSDGKVSPCIMSKQWEVGSVLDARLADLARSEKLTAIRSSIYHHVVATRKENVNEIGIHTVCTPKVCDPYSSCSPKWGPGPCEPSSCNPCLPKG
jgi:sulfatase maturation enzyme AslB (radical SAM superfamily)